MTIEQVCEDSKYREETVKEIRGFTGAS